MQRRLQSYVGKYKGEPGPEITITVKDGKLFATPDEPAADCALMALDKTTFQPAGIRRHRRLRSTSKAAR